MVNMNNAEISVCDKILLHSDLNWYITKDTILNRKVSELAVEYYIVDTISNKKIISIVK
jgi:hypothetical protein